MRQSAGVEHDSSDLTECELSYGMLKMLIIELSPEYLQIRSLF